jgi:hypothetical protein
MSHFPDFPQFHRVFEPTSGRILSVDPYMNQGLCRQDSVRGKHAPVEISVISCHRIGQTDQGVQLHFSLRELPHVFTYCQE